MVITPTYRNVHIDQIQIGILLVQVLRKFADIICISFTAGSDQASQQPQPVVKVEDQDLEYPFHLM